MRSPTQRQRIQVLLAPTDALALRLASSARRPARGSLPGLVEKARATRIDATITRAESELVRKRARRIAAMARRRVRDIGLLTQGAPPIGGPAFVERRSA
jgi:hypothetical protein